MEHCGLAGRLLGSDWEVVDCAVGVEESYEVVAMTKYRGNLSQDRPYLEFQEPYLIKQ